MGGPLPQQRVGRLRDLVLQRGAVTVGEVVELFGVSPMTARRDLAAVSRGPYGIRRVHGGAVVERPLRPATRRRAG